MDPRLRGDDGKLWRPAKNNRAAFGAARLQSSSFPRRRESIHVDPAADGSRELTDFLEDEEEAETVDRQPCVYILASRRAGTLYTGVTSDLLGRLYQHRDRLVRGFTAEYKIVRLVWYELHGEMESAIRREKRIKKWERDWKLNLIEQDNPDWRDLAIDFGFAVGERR